MVCCWYGVLFVRCAVLMVCCSYGVLFVRCAVCTVCCSYGVLFVRCAVLMVCCLYGALFLWCAVCTVSCYGVLFVWCAFCRCPILMVCCLYDALFFWCAVLTVCCFCDWLGAVYEEKWNWIELLLKACGIWSFVNWQIVKDWPVNHKNRRSRWPRRLRRRSGASRVLGLRVRILPEATDVCRVCCVLYRYRSLRRDDLLSRGVPPNVLCMWSRNVSSEEALSKRGLCASGRGGTTKMRTFDIVAEIPFTDVFWYNSEALPPEPSWSLCWPDITPKKNRP